ncbi:MAG: phosphohistidine phosphatase SixA [Deltaproteobacteria bacterium]|nr:phosphohistidine phosphatase SixA [Deltaproteobacteria bacterium]
MKLYLVQHGEAKSEIEDPDRSLTASGEKEVARVARAAKKMDIKPAKIYHSGKKRAKQTAEIIGAGLQVSDQDLEAVRGLNPNDVVRPWVEKIPKEKKDIMLVGHLPFLDKLTSLLLCGDENARVVLFRYGCMVCLEQKEDSNWAVGWVLKPEMV